MKRIKKNLKRYIAFLAVLIILFSLTATPAHALAWNATSRQRLGAMISSALLAGQIMLQSALAPVQNMYDYIPDALGIPTATWDDDYLDRTKVQIWPDYIEIDDVPYTDIWFSNEAAEKFRIDAYDFKTAYNIASNSNGTFASGEGYYFGVPVYRTDQNNMWTNTYTIPATTTVGNAGSIGDITVYNNNVFNNKAFLKYLYPNSTETGTFGQPLGTSQETSWHYNGGTWRINVNNQETATQNGFVADPFDFDWVSRTIPVPSPLPSDTGMMVRVPSDTPGLQTFITNNIDFTIDGGIELDFDLDPSLQVKIDDLIDIIAPIVPLLDFGDVTFVTNHETPVPPVQDTLLPDTWWSQVEYKFDQVINAIQNFSLQPVIQAIQTIPSTIQTIGGNIINTISDLGNTILQDIEQGPIKVIDKALDKLKSIFLPILVNLKNALGIWHYVVEWINGISAPFTWIFGIVQSGMSFIMVPIYATIAGWIVIMVYKRFGR